VKHLKLFENFDQSEVYYHGTKNKFDAFKVGSEVANPTYGKVLDHGLGIFFTDNLTMAKFFAGISYYDVEAEGYVDEPVDGARVVSAKLDIKNPFIVNDHVEEVDEDDPGQDYFDLVKQAGGGDKFRKQLIDQGYDGVIVNGATTNYYEEGSFSIVVVFDPSQIKVISKNVLEV